MVNEDLKTPAVSVPSVDTTSSSGLPVVGKSGSEEQVFRFYWLDAHEDYFKHPGKFNLFQILGCILLWHLGSFDRK